jgi:hypothetical protein
MATVSMAAPTQFLAGRRRLAYHRLAAVLLQTAAFWHATAIPTQSIAVSASQSMVEANALNALSLPPSLPPSLSPLFRWAMRHEVRQQRVAGLPIVAGSKACRSVRASSFRLKGGSSTDDEVLIEWGAATARIANVTLLVFDRTAVLWRERGHGTLLLSNLSSGGPSLAFFPDAADVAGAPVTAEPEGEALPPGGGGGGEGGATTMEGQAGEPLVLHELWELLEHQPLTALSSSRSLAYELPAERVSVFLGEGGGEGGRGGGREGGREGGRHLPEQDRMIGWRFLCV